MKEITNTFVMVFFSSHAYKFSVWIFSLVCTRIYNLLSNYIIKPQIRLLSKSISFVRGELRTLVFVYCAELELRFIFYFYSTDYNWDI